MRRTYGNMSLEGHAQVGIHRASIDFTTRARHAYGLVSMLCYWASDYAFLLPG